MFSIVRRVYPKSPYSLVGRNSLFTHFISLSQRQQHHQCQHIQSSVFLFQERNNCSNSRFYSTKNSTQLEQSDKEIVELQKQLDSINKQIDKMDAIECEFKSSSSSVKESVNLSSQLKEKENEYASFERSLKQIRDDDAKYQKVIDKYASEEKETLLKNSDFKKSDYRSTAAVASSESVKPRCPIESNNSNGKSTTQTMTKTATTVSGDVHNIPIHSHETIIVTPPSPLISFSSSPSRRGSVVVKNTNTTNYFENDDDDDNFSSINNYQNNTRKFKNANSTRQHFKNSSHNAAPMNENDDRNTNKYNEGKGENYNNSNSNSNSNSDEKNGNEKNGNSFINFIKKNRYQTFAIIALSIGAGYLIGNRRRKNMKKKEQEEEERKLKERQSKIDAIKSEIREAEKKRDLKLSKVEELQENARRELLDRQKRERDQ